MLFNSLEFLAFFAIVYSAYLVLGHRGQNWLLLVASYVFYGWWDVRFLSLIVAIVGMNYGVGLGLAKAERPALRKALVVTCVVLNLGVLGFFKYFGFFAENLVALANRLGWPLAGPDLRIVLPVGISFYTFQAMSYCIDVYRREIEPEANFMHFALFVAYFPQLVAGPIERAGNLLEQVRRPRTVEAADLPEALWLVAWGYFLKVFVADNLAPIVEAGFGTPDSGGTVLVSLYAFALQILGDFAGYSTIAIGLARLMGFRLMQNFGQPYFVANPRDFWRHWHISLSTFLRDYLYIPLGGSRGSTAATCRNLLLTMVIGGLWHGAAWNFVLWGTYHGLLLVLHRLLSPALARVRVPKRLAGVEAVLWVVLMFHATCLGWLFFRAQSLAQIGQMLRMLATDMRWSPPAIHAALQVLFFSWLALAVQGLQARKWDPLVVLRLPQAVRAAVLLAMFYSFVFWGEFGGKEFVYFQF